MVYRLAGELGRYRTCHGAVLAIQQLGALNLAMFAVHAGSEIRLGAGLPNILLGGALAGLSTGAPWVCCVQPLQHSSAYTEHQNEPTEPSVKGRHDCPRSEGCCRAEAMACW